MEDLHRVAGSHNKGIELLRRNDFVMFESRKVVFKRIMGAIKEGDEDVFIGIFGMGGIGKTTLVMELAKKAKEEELVSQVLVATVSRHPDIRKMQGMVADMLSLNLNEDTEIGRSNEIRTKVGKQRKILVILDDVWEKFDIECIGIPSQSAERKGYRIVLTTRRVEVCQAMGCRLLMHIDEIEEPEAYHLFATCARLEPRRKILINMALNIVRECGGLPLALVTVGRALRDKGLEEYEQTAGKLSKSRYFKTENVDREIYPLLEVSFEYLNDTEAQNCFLICSVYPDDTEIEMEELTRYVYGLRLFDNLESVDQVRQKIVDSVTKLVNACLLSLVEDYDTRAVDVYTVNYLSRLKMHDMLRDVALWIAKARGFFLLPTSLQESQRKGISEKTTALYLNSQDLSNYKFPQELACRNLKMLIIRIPPTKLSGNFFRKLSSLQVLDLVMETTQHNFGQFQIPMPVSFLYLVNLKVLRVYCEYLSFRKNGDMSIISKFKSLEILELSFRIEEKVLPEWVGELCNLRVLDLSQCFHLELIPCNLLPKLAQLEEFYTPRYHETEWSHAHLDDLRLLPHLSIVTGWFAGNDDFENRKTVLWSNHGKARSLRLDDFTDESMKIFEPIWPSVGCLDIGMRLIQGIKNLCPQLAETGFQKLCKLELSDSLSVECLIDNATKRGQRMRSANVLPNLLDLSLSGMKQLRSICNGPPPHLNFLGTLRCLEIVRCPRIENLVPDMFLVAPHITDICICSCEALKSFCDQAEAVRIHQQLLLSCESEKKNVMNVGYGAAKSLDDMLISLTSMDISHCNNLEEVFPVSEISNQYSDQKLKNLVTLSLGHLPKLECIWKVPQQNYCLVNLQTIYLSRCDKLSSVFTPNLAQSLMKLKSLVIKKCAMLETICSGEDKQDEEVWKRPHSSNTSAGRSFQELGILSVKSCPKLKTALPVAYAANCLPKLTYIKIENCGELEQVFEGKSQDVVMQNLKSLELVDLPKLVPFSEFTWNQMLISLHDLTISGTTFQRDPRLFIPVRL